MQDHPGAPGTARQGPTRIIMLVKSGGNATQPRAPGHERPLAALSAARHGRLSAATGAPGADVPLASKAGAPGQHCLSAAPRAPGHGRPLAALSAAGHDRLSAALRAPGADVPLATTARGAGSAPSACRAHRHRARAGRRQPAAPGSLAPRPCHSQHPDLSALPPRHRLIIPAPTEIRACAHQRCRGATCCARSPAQRGDPWYRRKGLLRKPRPPAARGDHRGASE